MLGQRRSFLFHQYVTGDPLGGAISKSYEDYFSQDVGNKLKSIIADMKGSPGWYMVSSVTS